MKYVVIGLGWRANFTALSKFEAIEIAFEFAEEARANTWLLYDDSLNLIADCMEGELK